MDWHSLVKAVEGSEVEGVFHPGSGDVGHEGPGDVCGDEAVAVGKGCVETQLLPVLEPFVGGELAHALGDLPVVIDCEEPYVTVSLAEQEVVGHMDLFKGGLKGGKGVCVARAGEFPNYAIEVAWVGSDGGHLGGMVVDLIIQRGHF